MKYYKMGCGLSLNQCKVRRSTAVVIFNEEQAKNIIGVSVVELHHNGKSLKLYYKKLSACPKTNSIE